MNLRCLERSEFKADAEWLTAYDEDLARTRKAYCAAATEFLSAPNLQYAYRAREEMRRIEEDWVRLIYLREDAERLRMILPQRIVVPTSLPSPQEWHRLAGSRRDG
jgi:hypothetical protein